MCVSVCLCVCVCVCVWVGARACGCACQTDCCFDFSQHLDVRALFHKYERESDRFRESETHEAGAD